MTSKILSLFCFLAILLVSCGGDHLITSHYNSGELKAEWHINGDRQKHGIEKQYYESGELKGVVKYVTGQMDSTATYYWKNGKPRKQVDYAMGIPNGKTTWFHKNGTVEKEVSFKDNKKVGLSNEFYASGQPKSTVIYQDNYREGLSRTWYESGKTETEMNYEGGRIEGEFVRYHENGTVEESGLMVKGQKAGIWRSYDSNGKELLESVYQEDILNGAFTQYFSASGKVQAIGEFQNGLLHGQVMLFNEAGHRVKTQQWIEGVSADGTNDLSWLSPDLSIKPEDIIAK